MYIQKGSILSIATVVIPTTGSATLEQAIQSVLAQTFIGTTCWVVIDGPQFSSAARSITNKYPFVKVLELPENTGADNFYGHRIYAAVGYLFNADYILYLDQDNWLDSTHVETMVNHIEKTGDDWVYSLRKIHDKNGKFLADDNCESLGKWPAWIREDVHLIDTSCWCIKQDVIVRISGAWYNKWGGDRLFLKAMAQHFPKWSCTGKHTLNYRLDGNPGSVTADFFEKGNAAMLEKYPTGFPWHNQ